MEEYIKFAEETLGLTPKHNEKGVLIYSDSEGNQLKPNQLGALYKKSRVEILEERKRFLSSLGNILLEAKKQKVRDIWPIIRKWYKYESNGAKMLEFEIEHNRKGRWTEDGKII